MCKGHAAMICSMLFLSSPWGEGGPEGPGVGKGCIDPHIRLQNFFAEILNPPSPRGEGDLQKKALPYGRAFKMQLTKEAQQEACLRSLSCHMGFKDA